MKEVKGFSLIELLVVVVIIAILVAVGIVAFNKYIELSRTVVIKTQGKQICNFAKKEIAKCHIIGDSSALDGTMTCPDDNKSHYRFPLYDTLKGKYKNPFTNEEPVWLYGHNSRGKRIAGNTIISTYSKQVYITTCYKETCYPKDPGPNPPIYHEGTNLGCSIRIEGSER